MISRAFKETEIAKLRDEDDFSSRGRSGDSAPAPAPSRTILSKLSSAMFGSAGGASAGVEPAEKRQKH
jgi:hypothetical protein